MTTGRLDAILAAARSRVERLRPQRQALERHAAATQAPQAFGTREPDAPVGVIAEVKRRSPAVGPIQETLEPVNHARAYAAGGAIGISVLTEEAHFGGSLEDLRRVTRAVPLPVLCKDFILDELQLFEARGAGAAAVLLIVRILSRERLVDLSREARGLGLGAVVEVHNGAELDVALDAGAAIVGVNSRDLDDFTIDLATVEQLLPAVPPGIVAVAESGIETRQDVERVAAAGADHVLVGTALARLPDPTAAVRGLVGVAWQGRGGSG